MITRQLVPTAAVIVGLSLTLSLAAADTPPVAAAALQSLPVDPMTSTLALIAKAEQQLQQPDIPAAIATLQQAIGADPGSSRAHTRLGGAYLLNQQYDDAVSEFQQAIARDANAAEAFMGMAMAYLHSGRMSLARAALVEARRIAPDKAASIDDVTAWIDQRAAGAVQ